MQKLSESSGPRFSQRKSPTQNGLSAPPLSKNGIREQLARILASEHFCHSRRYCEFLTFVVQKTLAGDVASLKERMIGVGVFSRSPDYDANANPIVRVTAGQIRKRLALYYYEPGRQAEIRIELPKGSYVPEFRPSVPARHIHAVKSERSPELRLALVSIWRKIHQGAWHTTLWACLVLAIVLASGFLYRETRADSVVDQFWSQVVSSPSPVALCVAKGTGTATSSVGIMLSDVGTMSVIRDTLEQHKSQFRLVDASTSDLSELRNDPVVFVGPFWTPWVKQATARLRFRIEQSKETKTLAITDLESRLGLRWTEPDGSGSAKSISRAIIARYIDRTIGRPVVIATGLSPQGTMAAGEVLTNPQYMKELLKTAPSDWQSMNLEAVIETQIVDGRSGPPTVDAVYFWN